MSEFKREDSDRAIKIEIAKPFGKMTTSMSSNSGKRRLVLAEDDDEQEPAESSKTNVSQNNIEGASTNHQSSTLKRSRWDDVPEQTANISAVVPPSSSKGKEKYVEVAETINDDEDTPWIRPNIVVKLLTKVANGKYRGQKARVIRTDANNPFVAECKVLDSGDVLKLDQADCETVVPALENQVMILRGKYSGRLGTLVKVDFDSYQAQIEVSTGERIWLDYEWFSKFME